MTWLDRVPELEGIKGRGSFKGARFLWVIKWWWNYDMAGQGSRIRGNQGKGKF